MTNIVQMRIFLLAITYFISFHIYAQNDKFIDWIDENTIKIEDANPDTKLSTFDVNRPQKFADKKIFGFGETTHHRKEFFDLKANFFKKITK